MKNYLRPRDLATALAALTENSRTILAGGTDFYPARVGQPMKEAVLDISGIESLRGVSDAGDYQNNRRGGRQTATERHGA